MKKKTNSAIRVVLVTAPQAEAGSIARTLLTERLAACVNLLPGVRSLYWWDEKIVDDAEVLMIVKAPAANMRKLLKRLKALHSYKVPEFLALPVKESNPDYRNWVTSESLRRHK
ncbi:MAG TPA: divalent-cation tolerance protein CutA [Planctomycetota bacterium]|nr:divalent-cation tolerance protein CutA [Planctomycetota bacterium]